MLVTSKSRADSSKVLRDLPEEFINGKKILVRSFPGTGNGRTKLISFKDALELVMVLPGKVAKEYRHKFADIIRAYLAGDSKLIDQIEANAVSTNPINRMARESMQNETPLKDDETFAGQKRLRDDMEQMVVYTREIKTNAEVTTKIMYDQLKIVKERSSVELDHLTKRDSIEAAAEARKLKHALDMLEVAKQSAQVTTISSQPAAPVLGRLPPGFTTVRKVYKKHEQQFSYVPPNKVEQILQSAGAEAKGMYVAKYSVNPAQVKERQHSVCYYPDTSEQLILDALSNASRRLTGQVTTIKTFMPVVVSVQTA